MRHISMTLVWFGLLTGGLAAAADWAVPDNRAASSSAETVPAGPARPADGHTSVGRYGDVSDDTVVGATEEPAQGLFGEASPPACEFCGGGNCLPPAWSVDASIQIIGTARSNNRTLGILSLPAGPIQVTSGTIGGQPLQYGFYNNAVNTVVIDEHAAGLSDSPAMDITISHYLGRDGEKRDYFIQAEFSGLERFYGYHDIDGTMVPVYSTTSTNINQTVLPPVLFNTGSLISTFPFPLPNLATSLFQATFPQNFDPTNPYAFNGATHMSVNTWSTFNNFEMNFVIAGNNQPDQMVLNPNGHFYRQCKTGYFFSYLFGLRTMVIDEMYEFAASGVTTYGSGNPLVIANPALNGTVALLSHGRYVVRTQNAILGLQTGGSLEYRFCRWAIDAHGKAGMFVNFANQDSLIQTALVGPQPDYLTPGQAGTLGETSTPYGAGVTQAAFAGGFGVGGSYKITPDLVFHASYDMLWVGDIARAADQFQFSPTIISTINARGSQFYDGFTFGLEYDW